MTEPEAEYVGLDLDNLRALAESAFPGPRTAEAIGSEGYRVYGPRGEGTIRDRRRHVIAFCGHEAWDEDRANAEFIAACDPATILTLLDRLDRAEHGTRPGKTHGEQS